MTNMSEVQSQDDCIHVYMFMYMFHAAHMLNIRAHVKVFGDFRKTWRLGGFYMCSQLRARTISPVYKAMLSHAM